MGSCMLISIYVGTMDEKWTMTSYKPRKFLDDVDHFFRKI